MDQPHRVEGEIDIQCDADKFFDVWCHKPYLVSKHCPYKYPIVELQEGECNKVGAIITWHYVCDEIQEKAFVKTKVEEIDEENKFVRYSYLDGLVLNLYKENFNSKIQAIPKGEKCVVKWSFEYEKKKQDVPDPNMYIDFLLGVAKDIGDELCST